MIIKKWWKDLDIMPMGIISSLVEAYVTAQKPSAILALCEGNPLVTGEFPSQKMVVWSFDIYFL